MPEKLIKLSDISAAYGNAPKTIRLLNRLGFTNEDIKNEYELLDYNYIWHTLNPNPSKGRQRKIKIFRKLFKGWLEMNKFVLFLVVVFVAGCAGTGFQITDSSTHNVLAYASGKAMAIGINKIRPGSDPELTSAWVDMMERNQVQDLIEPVEMVAFFNQCMLIVTRGEFDKYGLINDLSIMLTIYGADINASGQMVSIEPVPLEVLKYFEIGYANGRQVAREVQQ